jgi:hypothetical protein
MLRISLGFLTMLLSLTLVTCASTRVVSSSPGQGGVIALQRGLFQQEEARAQLASTMATNCGQRRPRVVKEGEVVVGQRTQSASNTNSSSQSTGGTVRVAPNLAVGQSNTEGTSTTTGNATTQDIVEWRIEYVCE